MAPVEAAATMLHSFDLRGKQAGYVIGSPWSRLGLWLVRRWVALGYALGWRWLHRGLRLVRSWVGLGYMVGCPWLGRGFALN